jgi:voltage-gated sodium channel
MEHSSWRRLERRFIRLRHDKYFEALIILVIVLSALLVGVKTYELPNHVEQALSIADIGISVFFLCELTIRFLGDENRLRFFHNGWNVFDTLIVVVSLIPIQDGDLVLIGRLIRVFRVLRMVSIVPELRMLINSLLKALPQLGYVALMMFIIFYIYAGFGATFFAKVNPDLWGNIAISMLTLFRVMTFEDWTDVMYETMVVYPWSWAYYLSFIFLSAFAFLNMIIGIVVGTINDEQQAARDVDTSSLKPVDAQWLARELHDIKQQLKRLDSRD